ncbi:DUF427 domain-containing protein [Caulobacter sp. SLTY]|uniref:DUF427 domain-containing protein n=1 Tax=Caulobacter sp. SLTY TaxID=2683262 RepID=UPI0014129AD1|nr:DUF427 domain-containing protein [Caulobacter sp. SLTY]NBB15974.1 DUF427 domain-containing protein [Caulobacter sp. SLTY]
MTESRLKFAAADGRVRALFEGHEIADSANALVLREGDYPPVVYFPREDVEMLVLRKTDKTSRCPFKGEASYYTIYRDRQIIENAAWSYEEPIEGAELIRGRIAFYPQHVDIEMGEAGSTVGDVKTFSADGNDAPFKVPAHDPPYADIDPKDRV